MSVTNLAGEKIDLPQDPMTFRHHLEQHWAKGRPHRWRQLAILSLVGDGWDVPSIAMAMGLHKGHVYRTLARARTDLQLLAANGTPRER